MSQAEALCKAIEWIEAIRAEDPDIVGRNQPEHLGMGMLCAARDGVAWVDIRDIPTKPRA